MEIHIKKEALKKNASFNYKFICAISYSVGYVYNRCSSLLNFFGSGNNGSLACYYPFFIAFFNCSKSDFENINILRGNKLEYCVKSIVKS